MVGFTFYHEGTTWFSGAVYDRQECYEILAHVYASLEAMKMRTQLLGHRDASVQLPHVQPESFPKHLWQVSIPPECMTLPGVCIGSLSILLISALSVQISRTTNLNFLDGPLSTFSHTSWLFGYLLLWHACSHICPLFFGNDSFSWMPMSMAHGFLWVYIQISPLLDIRITNIFSKSVAYHFILLVVSFHD